MDQAPDISTENDHDAEESSKMYGDGYGIHGQPTLGLDPQEVLCQHEMSTARYRQKFGQSLNQTKDCCRQNIHEMTLDNY